MITQSTNTKAVKIVALSNAKSAEGMKKEAAKALRKLEKQEKGGVDPLVLTALKAIIDSKATPQEI